MQKIKFLNKYIYQEFLNHKLNYLLVLTILVIAFFIRIYRLGDLMGFYFDQGRDALVIWKLWHGGKLFLIGPVTGLAGIFLGPFYYYLIAPFYLLSGGNPVYPAAFLGFIATLAIFIMYILAMRMQKSSAGFIAVVVTSFSYYIFLAGRWLANPTPILLTSILLLWSMWELININSRSKSKNNSVSERSLRLLILLRGYKIFWLWISIALLVGISLHFEAASAIFYIPMIIVFFICLYSKEIYLLIKNYTNGKYVRMSYVKTVLLFLAVIFVFFLTLLPQLVFNFRHENILLNNFKRIFIEEKSFRPNFWDVLPLRLDYFWKVFSSKIYPGWETYSKLFTLLSAFTLFVHFKDLWKRKIMQLFLIFLGVPMVGYIFFQGNAGNIYDYYMTGYYLPMILLFSIGLSYILKTSSGKLAILFFFITFFALNGKLIRNYLRDDLKGPSYVSLGNEHLAVDWIYNDAKKINEFNVDVYVPPVIPYAYDYLLLWQGTKLCGANLCGKVEQKVSVVYIIFEQDPPHPERLENWISRYYNTSVVQDEIRFGGISVQRRLRIN